jgi:hypothetical protein
VGAITERKIWGSGIKTMDDFIKSSPEFISPEKRQTIIDFISLSKEHIKNKNAQFFYENLPSKEHWRLFREFRKNIVYLDIETTGLVNPGDEITTIALYDGERIKYYVNGENLNQFKEDIQKYGALVTYNGKTFDIPFIENYFGIKISLAHLDLRYILRSLGYSGGLKSCERQLGIGRTGSLANVDGFFAILLWNDYQTKGNKKSLETLLSYNIEDVLNLEFLMIEAYNRKIMEVPFPLERIEEPAAPENPFKIDPSTVTRIQNQYYSF